jgi:hypothetical protein
MSPAQFGEMLGHLLIALVIASPWLYVGYEIFFKPVRRND